MLKIGIMTFHRAINYGAVLQAYALEKFLNKMENINCKIIDYRCKSIEDDYRLIKYRNGITAFVKSFMRFPINFVLKMKFKKFINNYLNLTNSVNTNQLKYISNSYDYFITGSDQVFNHTCAGFDKSYFLDFADSKKILSYAASFGDLKIKNQLINEYKNRLNRFPNISCRESSGKNFVEQKLNITAFEHIDPVFLLKKEEWHKLIHDVKYQKYILVYRVGDPVYLFEFAQKLSKIYSYKLIFLDSRIGFPKRGFKNLYTKSPIEFISLINSAQFIVTNSFHCTAFSIILHKKFFVELMRTSGINIRVSELIEKFKIKDVVLDNLINKPIISNINYEWEKYDKIIDKQIKLSDNYFRHNIK